MKHEVTLPTGETVVFEQTESGWGLVLEGDLVPQVRHTFMKLVPKDERSPTLGGLWTITQ